MPIPFDANDLEATRRQNRMLARMPRVTMHGLQRVVLQGLMNFVGKFATAALRKEGVDVDNRTVSALGRTAAVQIIRPRGPVSGVHIDIHGGGWSTGRAYMDGELNAAIAKTAGVVVVSIDYRLIPNVPLSEIFNDCETAARWVLDEGLNAFGVDRVTIGGESAGAHLAAVTLLRLRGKPYFENIIGALLLHGCYDMSGTPSMHTAPRDTLLLHAPSMDKLMGIVCNGISAEARRDPALSPLYADLTGLPPALFIVGTADPLIDDTRLMFEKWSAQSGGAELEIVAEAPHGFNRFDSSTARKTNAYTRAWLAARFDARLKPPAAA
ncbi:MAG: alpha/beta hydrolase [Rhodospirillaceae bacterium]|nr:alpha/beta hydrolase [Rhodospirillaceae bacterium]